MEEIQSKVLWHLPSVKSWKDSGYFTISGVNHRGEIATYDVPVEMYAPMSFNDFVNTSVKDEEAELPHGASMPLIYAIMEAGLRSGDTRFTDFIRNSLKRFPHTQTAIDYMPNNNLDRVVHNVGSKNQYLADVNLVGKTLWIRGLEDTSPLRVLLEAENIEKINKVSQGINGTDMYLSRLNSKPKQIDRRVAWFYASGDRLGLYCGRDLHFEYPAFRVLKVE